MLTCPALANVDTGNDSYSCYGMNQYLGPQVAPRCKLNQIKRPSSLLIFTDTRMTSSTGALNPTGQGFWRLNPEQFNTNDGYPDFRHGDMLCAAWVDGHASIIKGNQNNPYAAEPFGPGNERFYKPTHNAK